MPHAAAALVHAWASCPPSVRMPARVSSPAKRAPCSTLFPAMNVCGDKGERRRAPIFDPMWSRAKFSKYLTGPKLLRRAVVMVIGENSPEDVNDRRISLVAVKADMAARRHGCATDAQFAIFDAVNLLGQIDGGEHLLLHKFVVRRGSLLPQAHPRRKQHEPGQRRRRDPKRLFHHHFCGPFAC